MQVGAGSAAINGLMMYFFCEMGIFRTPIGQESQK
jgi:hypothetical protein